MDQGYYCLLHLDLCVSEDKENVPFQKPILAYNLSSLSKKRWSREFAEFIQTTFVQETYFLVKKIGPKIMDQFFFWIKVFNSFFLSNFFGVQNSLQQLFLDQVILDQHFKLILFYKKNFFE